MENHNNTIWVPCSCYFVYSCVIKIIYLEEFIVVILDIINNRFPSLLLKDKPISWGCLYTLCDYQKQNTIGVFWVGFVSVLSGGLFHNPWLNIFLLQLPYPLYLVSKHLLSLVRFLHSCPFQQSHIQCYFFQSRGKSLSPLSWQSIGVCICADVWNFSNGGTEEGCVYKVLMLPWDII